MEPRELLRLARRFLRQSQNKLDEAEVILDSLTGVLEHIRKPSEELGWK